MILEPQVALEPNNGYFLHMLKTFSGALGLNLMGKMQKFSPEQLDRIIEMAWEDRTPFDALEVQFGVSESEVIDLMRRNLKESSFKMWRSRVQGRPTKHRKTSPGDMDRFRCSRQKPISMNKISKR